MNSLPHLLPPGFLLLAITACTCAPTNTATHAEPNPTEMIKAIRAASLKEQSVIDVMPLRDPGVVSLQQQAYRDEQATRFQEAANDLDQALKLSPDAPDVLQDRAEMAIYLRDYKNAEQFARHSWELGPRIGPLCVRNWQTIIEMREVANDANGVATARKWQAECHKPSVPRY